jgi:ribosomal protein L29
MRFIHTMGLTQQNNADIKRVRADIAAINIRLNGPEAPRP